MLQGHERDGLVRRRRPAEEIDEQPALPGVLVGQRGDDAARVENLLHLVEVAVLGEQSLPGALAKRSQEFVEIGIVERPGDGVRAEAEQPDDRTRRSPSCRSVP